MRRTHIVSKTSTPPVFFLKTGGVLENGSLMDTIFGGARNNPKYEPDPDIARCEALIESLRTALNEKSNDDPNG